MSGYKIKFNGLDRIYSHYKKDLDRAARSAWRTGNVLIGRKRADSQLGILENLVTNYVGRAYGIGVLSCTDALYFALRAHGIGPGKTVICPALSFLSTATAIKRTGAQIKFVDVGEDGQIGDLKNLKADVLVYVNLYGNLADYERIKYHCYKNKMLLVEDAAQSFGACYKKNYSGSMGDISVLSFSPTKNLPAFGSGGMILTDNKDIEEKCLALRYHGVNNIDIEYGYNSVMPEGQSAQLNVLMMDFDTMQNKRQEVRNQYNQLLTNNKNVRVINAAPNTIGSNHKLVILCEKRDGLKKFLAEKGIETQIHYDPILPYTKYFKNKGSYPNAEKISNECLSLPIYPHLKSREINYICGMIKEYYGL
jgi:UDP-2-acetamido-2-deoxy-ribo-hexuluronate aminotransferase